MPSYEYICKSEHSYTEVRSIFADQEKTTCPECDSELKRVFESVPVTFQGEGFYAKDRKSLGI